MEIISQGKNNILESRAIAVNNAFDGVKGLRQGRKPFFVPACFCPWFSISELLTRFMFQMQRKFRITEEIPDPARWITDLTECPAMCRLSDMNKNIGAWTASDGTFAASGYLKATRTSSKTICKSCFRIHFHAKYGSYTNPKMKEEDFMLRNSFSKWTPTT